jgi:hypothetical protein
MVQNHPLVCLKRLIYVPPYVPHQRPERPHRRAAKRDDQFPTWDVDCHLTLPWGSCPCNKGTISRFSEGTNTIDDEASDCFPRGEFTVAATLFAPLDRFEMPRTPPAKVDDLPET